MTRCLSMMLVMSCATVLNAATLDIQAERATLFRLDKAWASEKMAYSLATNTITLNDAQGHPLTEQARAVTVWRKAADGNWKCVVDT